MRLIILCLIYISCNRSNPAVGPSAADVAKAASRVEAFIASNKSATLPDIAHAIQATNTTASSGWVHTPVQVSKIAQDIFKLLQDLNNLSLTAFLQGTTYPEDIETDLIKLITDYFAAMPDVKAADGIQFVGVKELISELTSLVDLSKNPSDLSIIERLAQFSNQTIDLTNATTAIEQVKTILGLHGE